MSDSEDLDFEELIEQEEKRNKRLAAKKKYQELKRQNDAFEADVKAMQPPLLLGKTEHPCPRLLRPTATTWLRSSSLSMCNIR